MIIPELILLKAINILFNYIREDYQNNVLDETKSFLYSIYNFDDNGDVIEYDKMKYFESAKGLFLRTNNNARLLKINLGYDLSRQNVPTIHILLPSEVKGRMDGIGYNEGLYDSIQDVENQTELIIKTYSHLATYSLLITSNNMAEVTLIYTMLKVGLIIMSDHLELLGLQNLKQSGQDVKLDQNLGPNDIFHRELTVQFDYEDKIPIKNYRDISDYFNLHLCNNVANDTFGIKEEQDESFLILESITITNNEKVNLALINDVNGLEYHFQVKSTTLPEGGKLLIKVPNGNYRIRRELDNYQGELIFNGEDDLSDRGDMTNTFTLNGDYSFHLT